MLAYVCCNFRQALCCGRKEPFLRRTEQAVFAGASVAKKGIPGNLRSGNTICRALASPWQIGFHVSCAWLAGPAAARLVLSHVFVALVLYGAAVVGRAWRPEVLNSLLVKL